MKSPQIAKTTLRKKVFGGINQFQDILQSDSNKNSMELAQKKACRSMNKLDLNVHVSNKTI